MNNAQELIDMQNEIEETKKKAIKLSGQLEVHLKKLKEIDCENTKEAKEKLKLTESKISKLEKRFEEGMENLKEKYEWEE